MTTWAELLRQYDAARTTYDDATAEAKALNAPVKALEREIVERAELEELSKLPVVEGLPTFQVLDKTSVKTLDKEAVATWMKKNGMENLLSVNARTLASIIAERMGAGLEVPASVEVSIYQIVSRRK